MCLNIRKFQFQFQMRFPLVFCGGYAVYSRSTLPGKSMCAPHWSIQIKTLNPSET
ncbi:unnamed protein product [Amoebophrya sp. A120]|nr:unnamed protein product [Amoebophrya sp. A120]|eukprot:GSA120T00020882001.1